MKSINTIIMNEGSGKSCHPGPLLVWDETECFCEPIEENIDNLKEVRLYVIVETHRPVERLGYNIFNGRYLM
jgi:hypothetical protein